MVESATVLDRPGPRRPGRRVAAPAPTTAARYGRFELTHKLGEGAMGQVWAARDPGLGREVAIKVMALPVELSTEGADRMRREAQAMARLSHPNVVRIYELGTEGDQVFCAMELVDGETWRQWLTTPRSWREILAVGVAVARGIEATHAAGLLHRDIKPDNVLIARDGRTLLTDFGLAKLASDQVQPSPGPRPPGDTRLADLTASGALLGTPSYMAPEQLHGLELDARSDQFSFCVSLFEALTGERPFRGPTLLDLVSSLETAARWPKRAGRVPAGVRKVVLRGLSIEPEQRYPSMAELARALERATAAPRRRLVLAAAAVIVLGGLAAVLLFPRHDPVTDERSAAHSKMQSAWNQQRRLEIRAAILATGAPGAEKIVKQIEDTLDDYTRTWLDARMDAWSATHVREEQSLDLLDRRIACYDRLAGEVDAVAGVLAATATAKDASHALGAVSSLTPVKTCADPLMVGYGTLDGDPRIEALEHERARIKALWGSGDIDKALAGAQALTAATDQLGVPELNARALFLLGLMQGDSNHPADAEPTFRRTIQEAARAQDHMLVARTWYRLMQLLGDYLGRTDEALALEPAARAAIAQAGGDVMQYGMLDLALGELHSSTGDLAQSERELRRAQKEFATARGPDHVSQVIVLSNLGAVLVYEGKLDDAETTMRRALELARKRLGPKSMDYALLLGRFAMLEKRREDWAAMESYSREALKVFMAAAGPDNPQGADSRMHLVTALMEQGKLDQAEKALDNSQAVFEKSLPAGHPNFERVMLLRSQLAERRKHYDLAITWARRAVAARRAGQQQDPMQLANALDQLAEATAHEHPRDAVAIFDQVLEAWTSKDDRNRAEDAPTLDEMAAVALRAHRPEAALRWFVRLPEAAKKLAGRRRQLERAARRGSK